MRQFISTTILNTALLAGRRKFLFCRAILLSILCFAAPELSAAAVTETPDKLPGSGQEADVFEYVLEGRPDPFVPFITEKAAVVSGPTVNMNEIIEKKVVLTGMQLFEPGQLTLVALLQSETEDFAMVQDFTGKGYMITVGTKIGRKGVVKKIVPNMVIIEETAETRAGKKIITEVLMSLKKEGEE